MSQNTRTSSSGGIGFAGLLTIVFIVLKLVGVIAWSWWWVLAPLWIGFALWLVLVAVLVLTALAAKR
ncbi:hypothetical protein EDF51_106129 [Curtobacterium sp. PhB25]|uniref:hypothetical protein n=1 Tax=Curtobacterium sp. PhB25 TaxID=2485205 RepID=UPI001064B75F|nr:hypothetical protein [Curtobacterium sp. PhB25]TDW69145.1 hypothetical protein EDF51_106129 [Curtobacterium sp. PhB25]